MALHWEHIKGFNGDAATGSSTTAGTLYTYIEYQKGPKSASPVSSANETLLPNILVSSQNIQGNVYENGTLKSGVYNCGHIVTTDIKNTFTEVTRFNEPTRFRNPLYLEYGTPIYYGQQDEQDSVTGGISVNANGHMVIHSDYAVDIYGNESLTGGIHINNGGVIIGDSGNRITSYFYNNIEAQGYVQATYFNATSDKRAKENFIPIPNNMLELVEKMQVYTFNYKNNILERTIGLIAQEVEDINIDGFSLVANKTALGKEDDFMSIHESKLVYILLEAVKELSAQVKELKSKIGE